MSLVLAAHRALEPLLLPVWGRAALAVQRHHLPTRYAPLHTAFQPLDADERRVLEPVQALRARLAASDDVVAMQDFGAGTRAGALATEARPSARRVAEIYTRAAVSPAWGTLLYALVRTLRPRRILELGTNLGVSAAYLQLALGRNAALDAVPGRLVTLEGDPTLAGLARTHLAALDGPPTEVVVGRFQDTLDAVLSAHGPFDFVFLDGHHEEAATRTYAAQIEPHLAPGALLLFDDIEPGRPVRRAWTAFGRAHPAADRLDLGKWGLLFVP